MRNSSVYAYISEKLRDHALLAILLDPEYTKPDTLANIALDAVEKSVDLILIGGSSHVDPEAFFSCIIHIKEKISMYNIPIVIYTEDFNMATNHASAILYGAVLNSNDPHYLVKMPVFSAPLIKKINLEVLNTAFLIFEPGGTVGHVLNVQLIPRTNPKLGLAYSQAAELLGYKLVYLESGSKSPTPLPKEIVKLHRNQINIPIIVGGGIKDPIQAKELVEHGASIIVIGTAFEQGKKIEDFVKIIHSTPHINPLSKK